VTPPHVSRRRADIVRASRVANFVGAVVAFVYLRFLDPVTSGSAVTVADVGFFLVAFTLLTLGGVAVSTRWSAPMFAGAPDSALVRRRALLFPWAIAGVSLMNWAIAGVIWGVLWPLVTGTFTRPAAMRAVFGITGVGGVVTAAIVFFSVERRWRSELSRFFPDGDLGAVRRVPRLPVRARLLLVFLLTSVGPLLLLGVIAYRRRGVAAADPGRAGELLAQVLMLIAFFIVVGIVVAVRLSFIVADSVAAPLREVETAMARVGQGDLSARCPVVSNDELGAVAEGFNRMLEGLRERETIKETFGRYVTREVRDEILAGRVSFEGEQREVTVLFADLRDFTPWVEATEPRAVVRDLNAYFGEMDAAIRAHGGLVLQFIGDEIEAVFGAPVPTPDHAARAVRAALEMRARLAAWNAGRDHPLRHGVGVHTGPVLAGAIGSRERFSYALVGDTVNLASRIQGLTKEVGADIVVSATTARGLDGAASLAPLPAVRVKGKSAEVEVFRVV
jgi:adenylate cyclase